MKIAPRVGQVGEDPRACPACGRSLRGSRRGCPCRCQCPCRRRRMPALTGFAFTVCCFYVTLCFVAGAVDSAAGYYQIQ